MGNFYFGVNGVARQVKNVYIGVNGVARKVKSVYFGVNGVARQSFKSETYIYNKGKLGLATGFVVIRAQSTSANGDIKESTFSCDSQSISFNFNKSACLVTENKIDLTSYKKLYAEYYNPNSSTHKLCRLEVTETLDRIYDTSDAKAYITEPPEGKNIISLDISSIKGGRYISFRPPGYTGSSLTYYRNGMYLFRIWME